MKHIYFRLFISIVLSILAVSASWFICISFLEMPLHWPGWYILKLPANSDEEPIVRYLQSHGINGFLSSSTAMVNWMAIPNLNTAQVDEIDTILPVGDPRRDPFLGKVGKLFRSGLSPIIYLPSTKSLSYYKKLVSSSQLFQDSILLDDVQGRQFILMILFVIFLGIICKLLPGAGLQGFVAFIPWAIPSLFLGGIGAYSGLILCILTSYIIELRGIARLLLIFLTATIFISVAFYIPMPEYFPILSGCISSILLCCMFNIFPINISNNEKWEHKIFEPEFLTDTMIESLATSSATEIIKPPSLILLPIIIFFIPLNVTETGSAPIAGKSLGAYDSISAIQTLFMESNSESLPTFSDLVASYIFQSGFLNKSRFEIPLPGTQLTNIIYRNEGNRIHAEEVSVINYDMDWYNQLLNFLLSNGIGQLYSTLDGPAPIMMSTITKPNEPALPVKVLSSIFISGITIYAILQFSRINRLTKKSRLLKKVRVA